VFGRENAGSLSTSPSRHHIPNPFTVHKGFPNQFLFFTKNRNLSTINPIKILKMNGESRRWDRKDLRRSSKKQKLMRTAEEELESKLGFDLFTEGDKRLGWLLTFSSVSQSNFFP
jgi:hypothetical protein